MLNTRHAQILVLASALGLLLSGCPETLGGCAPGFVENDNGECNPVTPPDGGPDSGIDSGTDAGPPCGGCTDPTPICDTDLMSCVVCLVDTDCGGMHCDIGDPTDPTDNACVQCVTDAHCEGVSGAPNCDTDTNMCFGCSGDVDCTDPNNAQCDTGSGRCMPCSDSAHCAGVPNAGICDMSGESGVCVECLFERETACPSGSTCNLLTSSCVEVGAGTVTTCGACTNDRQCAADHRCIELNFMDEPRETGYCLQRATVVSCEAPFLFPIARESIANVPSETYCGINENMTSCEAINGLLDNLSCPGGTDEECPQPGGLCRRVGVASNRCTYPCTVDDNCTDMGTPGGEACGLGGTAGPEYCGGG